MRTRLARLNRIAAIPCLAMTIAACGSTNVENLEQVAGPSPVRCQASVSSLPALPASGGSVRGSVTTERECSWSMSPEVSWLQLAPRDGQGQTEVTFTATANPDARVRSGDITLNQQRVSVTQEAAPCRFAWVDADLAAAAGGEQLTARMQSPGGCAWTAQSSVAWIQVSSASGDGTRDVALAVSANSGAQRSGSVVAGWATLTVTQAARSAGTPAPTPAPVPTPSPIPSPGPLPTPAPSCSYVIDPERRVVGDGESTHSVKIKTTSPCGWTVASGAEWIEIRGDSSGTGSDDVRYTVSRNTGATERTGTISIAGQTHTVVQRAK